MVWIPGGTFTMGSDHHYPEEAPAHRVRVEGFWIDRAPVTNAQFQKFVKATGHVHPGRAARRSGHYPDALPELLAAVLDRVRPAAGAGGHRRSLPLVAVRAGGQLAPSRRPGQLHQGPRPSSRGACGLSRMRWPMPPGPARHCPAKRNGSGLPAAGWRGAEFAWGSELHPGGRADGQHLPGGFPPPQQPPRRLRAHLPGGVLSRRMATACST